MGGPPKVPFGFRVSTTRHGGRGTNCCAGAAGSSGAEVIWPCATADIAVTARPNTRRNLTEREIVCMCYLHNLFGQVRLGGQPRYQVPGSASVFTASSECVASQSLAVNCWELQMGLAARHSGFAVLSAAASSPILKPMSDSRERAMKFFLRGRGRAGSPLNRGHPSVAANQRRLRLQAAVLPFCRDHHRHHSVRASGALSSPTGKDGRTAPADGPGNEPVCQELQTARIRQEHPEWPDTEVARELLRLAFQPGPGPAWLR